MSSNRPGMKRYQSLGVKQIIAASGAVTAHGGSKLRPEVMAAMNDTAGLLVDMEALNRQAGQVLAHHTGAQAGLVTSGAAGGLVLQAAAVVAGNDPARPIVKTKGRNAVGTARPEKLGLCESFGPRQK